MFAIECSKPMAVKAKTGHHTAKIFPTVSLVDNACHHARHTNQFAPIPRRSAFSNPAVGVRVYLTAQVCASA